MRVAKGISGGTCLVPKPNFISCVWLLRIPLELHSGLTGRAGEPRRPCNELIARLELLKRSDESISCIGNRWAVPSVLIVTK